MICKKCGFENDDNATYCSNCGEFLWDFKENAAEDEETKTGIKSTTLLKVVGAILLLMLIVFIYLFFVSKQDNREEIYTFYITDQDGDLLMQGGIDRAELEEVTNSETNDIEYNVEVNLTKDATVIFENITDTNLNQILNIYLDDELLLSSTINSVISNGQLYIPVYDAQQGDELVFKLNNTKR